MTDVLRTLSFPAPAALINMNGRMHWSKLGTLVAAWRGAAAWHSLRHYKHTDGLPAAIVDVALPVKGNRRRDPMNMVPTVKAIVDGLVDAGWWADDSAAYVRVLEPTLVVGGTLVTVTARAR